MACTVAGARAPGVLRHAQISNLLHAAAVVQRDAAAYVQRSATHSAQRDTAASCSPAKHRMPCPFVLHLHEVKAFSAPTCCAK
jgi:hypothetical protein